MRGSTTVTYTYDLNNRLTKEATRVVNTTTNTVYTYDNNGNQLTKKVGSGTTVKFVWSRGNIVWDNAESATNTWYIYGIGRIKSIETIIRLSIYSDVSQFVI